VGEVGPREREFYIEFVQLWIVKKIETGGINTAWGSGRVDDTTVRTIEAGTGEMGTGGNS